MLEAQLERALVREIERRGGMARKFVSPGWRGAPDRIVLMPGGRIWFVELKAPGEKPRPLQAHRLGQLSRLGFGCRYMSNKVELDRFLREVDNQ